MPRLLDDLVAFLQEHRHCGVLDSDVEGNRVWMACSCGARIMQALSPALCGVGGPFHGENTVTTGSAPKSVSVAGCGGP